MKLTESYRRVRECIVAFSPKQLLIKQGEPLPEIFPIFGTGVIIREYGLIVTNDHVVEAFKSIPKPPNSTQNTSGIVAIFFKHTGNTLKQVPLDVCATIRINNFIPGTSYFGPPKPDIAFVMVKAKGLPFVEIDNSTILEEGLEVATAGFPLGDLALTAPGWLHQVTPTLQKGIISAVLPFMCSHPHAFTINIMVQGGASGSPIFLPETGKILGILYGSLTEPNHTSEGLRYSSPTNISYVVPSNFFSEPLKQLENDPKFQPPKDALTLEEILTTRSSRMISGRNPNNQIKEIFPPASSERKLEKLS